MQFGKFYAELSKRRVIRAALIYAALLWALLQVADLLAGAEIISETTVRWLIILGVVGFPLTLIASWFFETPWRERRWISVAGDVLIIVAIAVAAVLFAWQQWFASFSRPIIAVMPIEATDTRDDTRDLADHLTKRFRMLLATRVEIRVIELESSAHASLANLPRENQAAALNADLILTGTLSRGGDDLRLSVQLYDRNGELLWGESFEDQLVDQQALQTAVLTDLLPVLPVKEEGLDALLRIIGDCDYPDDAAAILALAGHGRPASANNDFRVWLRAFPENGLMHLEQARSQFAEIPQRSPTQQSVLQSIALNSLTMAKQFCGTHPDVGLLRLLNTGTVENEGNRAARYLSDHPNSAGLYLRLADAFAANGIQSAVHSFVTEAHEINPASPDVACRYRETLAVDDADTTRLEASMLLFEIPECAE